MFLVLAWITILTDSDYLIVFTEYISRMWDSLFGPSGHNKSLSLVPEILLPGIGYWPKDATALHGLASHRPQTRPADQEVEHREGRSRLRGPGGKEWAWRRKGAPGTSGNHVGGNSSFGQTGRKARKRPVSVPSCGVSGLCSVLTRRHQLQTLLSAQKRDAVCFQ